MGEHPGGKAPVLGLLVLPLTLLSDDVRPGECGARTPPPCAAACSSNSWRAALFLSSSSKQLLLERQKSGNGPGAGDFGPADVVV